jgi:predicted Rossmann fold nucleotide-binding protein DprA/Smf involved in DNA uptake
VLARDRHRCVVPGCSGRDYVHVHPIRPRALGGTHDPALLATLCAAHHRAVHEGTLRVAAAAGRVRCFDASGRALGDARESPPLSAPATSLLDALTAAPAEVDALIEASGLPTSRALAALAELQFAGLAHRSGAHVSAA